MTTEEFTDTLEQLATWVMNYSNMEVLEGHELNKILQKITTLLYSLENERADYHIEFQGIVKFEVNEGSSVAKAVNTAHCVVPNLYLMRRIMEAAYRVTDAIRSNISFLKTERHSI